MGGGRTDGSATHHSFHTPIPIPSSFSNIEKLAEKIAKEAMSSRARAAAHYHSGSNKSTQAILRQRCPRCPRDSTAQSEDGCPRVTSIFECQSQPPFPRCRSRLASPDLFLRPRFMPPASNPGLETRATPRLTRRTIPFENWPSPQRCSAKSRKKR